MANVVVAESHLTFGGSKYFRGGAQVVNLLSIGEKRTPLTGQNYLEVKDSIPPGKVPVTKSGVVEINFNATKKSAFTTAVTALIEGVPVKLDGGAAFERMSKHELKLVLLSIMPNDLKTAVNNAPKAMADLVNWGNDARAAHQVFYVMDAKTASQFGSSGTVQLGAGVKGLEATVGASSGKAGSSVVVLPSGMAFAYMLAKFDWDAKQDKNVTKAVDVDDDQWSMN